MNTKKAISVGLLSIGTIVFFTILGDNISFADPKRNQSEQYEVVETPELESLHAVVDEQAGYQTFYCNFELKLDTREQLTAPSRGNFTKKIGKANIVPCPECAPYSSICYPCVWYPPDPWEPPYEWYPSIGDWYKFTDPCKLEGPREYHTAGYPTSHGGRMIEDVSFCRWLYDWYPPGIGYYYIVFDFLSDHGGCFPGQSGSPVWTLLDDMPYVIGILRTRGSVTNILHDFMLAKMIAAMH